MYRKTTSLLVSSKRFFATAAPAVPVSTPSGSRYIVPPNIGAKPDSELYKNAGGIYYETGHFSDPFKPVDELERTTKGAIVVSKTAMSLEWLLPHPLPLHSFQEAPAFVEWPEGEDVGHH